MPFNVGDDVYVCSARATGVVVTANNHPFYEVNYDVLPGSGIHHEDDLKSLPYKGRHYEDSFYIITDAKIVKGVRCCDLKYRRNDGRRI